MIFAHDTEVALTAAAALVNTGSDTEELADLACLDWFVADWRWTGSRTHDQAQLDAVRRLRPRLAQLWELPEDDAVQLVNALLRERTHCLGWSSTTAGTTTCTPRHRTLRWPTGWRSRRRWRSPTSSGPSSWTGCAGVRG